MKNKNSTGLEHDTDKTVNPSIIFGKLTEPESLKPKTVLKTLREILLENKSVFEVIKGKGASSKIRLPWFNYEKCLWKESDAIKATFE